ncbi:MAG TPA: glucosidase, partial [Planctomycetota bacterium]|nr:glucosidase [Planctomycetota bacterium]
MIDAESKRLLEAKSGAAAWRRWGPYLSERQWGTVREDYSADGAAWDHVTHDAARSKAYRWGEDGIAGWSDDLQRLCFSVAFWNGRDPVLKERLFGLSGPQGNHGEDVKEHYAYLDGTPSHAWMRMLYKATQREYPYAALVEENRRRSKAEPEYELLDTGVFDEDRYFDVTVDVAKAAPDDLCIRITVRNRGPEASTLHVLPQLFFRNTWSWTSDAARPRLALAAPGEVEAEHAELGTYRLYCDGAPEIVFCDNDTNVRRLYGVADARGYFKDGVDDYVVRGVRDAVNPAAFGTKCAAIYRLDVPAGGAASVRVRLTATRRARPFADFDAIHARRLAEADAFYAVVQRGVESDDARLVQRQAFAGMLWSKQYYGLDVPRWLRGDPAQPAPPEARRRGRNRDWEHLNNADVLSMPDKWEYPWYATWDLAFHCIPLALIDPEFAKDQLTLLTREWYMHPNGQMPAYEWAFGDVNPPVHAWAAWRVFQIDRKRGGGAGDFEFLERVFHKLCLNFTWWVNRKDAEGRNLFQGGFLGLDNIGLFDRSAPLPGGGRLEQADGTAWMAMYALNLMRIALELATRNPVYQDLATKFFEHFLHIAGALNAVGGEEGEALWDPEDEFFYDVLHDAAGRRRRLKVRSMVGLVPLFAVETLDPELLERVPEFTRRLEWFLEYRPDLAALVSRWREPGVGERRLLALCRG